MDYKKRIIELEEALLKVYSSQLDMLAKQTEMIYDLKLELKKYQMLMSEYWYRYFDEN